MTPVIGPKMLAADPTAPRSRSLLRAGAFALALVASTRAVATVVEVEFSVNNQRFGAAKIRLFDSAMPNSVENFLDYFGRYPGTFIHRNPRNSLGGPDGNFVVQGGGFRYEPSNMTAPGITTDPPIADEPGGGVQGISNLRGTLANAKSGPNTSTSQWFVNLSDNTFLDSPTRPDGGFGAFGRVIAGGMAVFDAIDLLPKLDLDSGSLFNDVPVGNVSDPLNTLVTVSRIEILNLPAGDYNFDGKVDAADYVVWRNDVGFNRRGEADGNGDGKVDQLDYVVWRDSYNALTVLPAAGVPEPGASLTAVAGLAGLLGRRRRRQAKKA